MSALRGNAQPLPAWARGTRSGTGPGGHSPRLRRAGRVTFSADAAEGHGTARPACTALHQHVPGPGADTAMLCPCLEFPDWAMASRDQGTSCDSVTTSETQLSRSCSTDPSTSQADRIAVSPRSHTRGTLDPGLLLRFGNKQGAPWHGGPGVRHL